jgi:arylsulfatase A-like enzyme
MAHISRRVFIKNAGLGAIAAAALGTFNAVAQSAGPDGKSIDQKPNIIVILADDLGWGDLSCYPQDTNVPAARIRTPNLDSLAAEGVRFTQGYATCMVCSPSRAGLLTGRYQQRFGYYEFKETLAGIPKNELMLQEFLKKQGYATACIGKWHVGHKPELGPLTRGFDRFYGFLGGQHDYFDPNLGDPTMGFSMDRDAYILDQDKPVKHIDYLTDELTTKSIQFMDEQVTAGRPFFLYLPYSAPHPPMQSTWDKLEPYAAEKGGKFDSRDLARAMINSMDDGIGRILDRLMHLGIDRNTLIFFTSDNGGADDGDGTPAHLVQHNGGLRARKGFYWEGGIRVPYIIRWPVKIPEGIVCDKPVSQLDIFATCAAAVGAALPESLDGVDLVPYLTGNVKTVPHDVMYWGLDEQVDRWAIRKGKWKLACEYRDPQTTYDKTLVKVTELHDIEADMFEQHDLSAVHPEIVKELLKLKEDFYKSCAPTIFTPEMRKAWEEETARRKQKLPNPDALRRDGAPGHWLK